MISDEELEQILAWAAEAVVVPGGATQAIRAKAGAAEEPPSARRAPRHLAPRELTLAGLSAAAVIALIVVLVTQSSPLPTPTPYSALSKPSGVASTAPPLERSAANGATFSSAGPHLSPSAVTAKGAATKGRAIVATGTLHLTVSQSSLASAVQRLEALAGSLGGFVGNAAVTETGRDSGGSLVLDVPAKSFGRLVSFAGHAGSIRSLSTSDQDVTGQVVDLSARLTALTDERSQLEVLLGRAAKVSDLLAVESQIEAVQSSIEQIQGEQRVLAEEVSYSALTVELAVVHAHHVPASTTGFDHAFHAAVSGFVNGVKALVAHLGDIVFTILVVLIGLLVLWLLWRRVWPILRRRLA